VKLLLDTHIWIWTTGESHKLAHRVRRELEGPRNEMFLSPISLWEAHQAYLRKRLRIQQEFPEWLEKALSDPRLQEAPLNFAVATEASRIHLPQPDPGDLFLAATASVFGMTLVTADPQLIDCRWLKTLPND
jgi:PIN domain nuclease of toxin-antitoxin system